MRAKQELLEAIPRKASDRDWVEENVEDLYNGIRSQLRSTAAVEEVVANMIYLIPQLRDNENIKVWGRLLEETYNKTPFVNYNGLDGVNTYDLIGSFVFTKRPKIQQLPTKTQRRKRIILHPTQMLEIYLILFMAYNYPKAQEVKARQFEEIMRLSRAVNDAYCTNKMHLVFAFMYLARLEFELAIDQAHIAYNYWKDNKNDGDAGLAAYALGLGYQHVDDLALAQQWLERASSHMARTSYRRQYGGIAMATSSLKIMKGEYEAAKQWGFIALDEYEREEVPARIATSHHMLAIAKCFTNEADEALEHLDTAQDMFAEQQSQYDWLHAEYTRAYAEARNDDTEAATRRLDQLEAEVVQLPDSQWKSFVLGRMEELHEMIRTGEYA
jgi:tetratricopeptide (TPR) repeat protein